MAKITRWKVVTKPADDKMKRYLGALKTQISLGPSVPGSVVNLLIEQISARAPSMGEGGEEEYYVMYGTQGPPPATLIAKGKKKGEPIDAFVPARIRFTKERDQLWIKEAVQFENVNEISEEGNLIGYRLGNVVMLNQLTGFTWVDATKGWKKAGAQSYPHFSPYGLFAAFEYGSGAIGWGDIRPMWHTKMLVPTDETRLMMMRKTIPAFNMYGWVTKDYVKGLIQEEIALLKSE